MGVSFFLKGMDGPTVNHSGQKLIPGENWGTGQGRRKEKLLLPERPGIIWARLEVLFTVWITSLGVGVTLAGGWEGGVGGSRVKGWPWGDRRGEGRGFWDGLVLGSNALTSIGSS